MSSYFVFNPGRLFTGRKFAYNSNFCRSATLIDENPSPTGVVTGPFSATRFCSIDSYSALGMYSPVFANASAPAANVCHSNSTSVAAPAASKTLTTAPETSGPIPSPGINVTLCVLFAAISRLLPLFQIFPAKQLFQLLLELPHIFEVPIHTCKPDICHRIDILQPGHNQFANL